jgi:hypothetical protein
LENKPLCLGEQKVQFQTKLEQAVNMLTEIANFYGDIKIINVADSWFGNNGLWKPLREAIGSRFQLMSRLRSNINLSRSPHAVINHLHFRMTATSLTWIYASRMEKTPDRRHAVKEGILPFPTFAGASRKRR